MVGVLAAGWVIWGVVFVFGGAQHRREVFGRFQSVGRELEEKFLVHAAGRACYAQGGHYAFPVVEDRDGNCENLGDSLGQGDRKSFVEHGLESRFSSSGSTIVLSVAASSGPERICCCTSVGRWARMAFPGAPWWIGIDSPRLVYVLRMEWRLSTWSITTRKNLPSTTWSPTVSLVSSRSRVMIGPAHSCKLILTFAE